MPYLYMFTYCICFDLQLENSYPAGNVSLGIKVLEFPQMLLNHLKQCIKCIDANYFWSIIPSRGLLILFVHYHMVASPYIFPMVNTVA